MPATEMYRTIEEVDIKLKELCSDFHWMSRQIEEVKASRQKTREEIKLLKQRRAILYRKELLKGVDVQKVL